MLIGYSGVISSCHAFGRYIGRIRYLIANSSDFYLKYNALCKFVISKDYYLFSQF